MKKSILYLLLLSLTIVTSCKKDDSDDQKPVAKLSVKVEGAEWSATKNIKGYYILETNMLQISGTTDDPMDFLILSTLGYQSGTYPMTTVGNSATYQLYTSNFDFSRDGEIVITSCDTVKKLVTGTFRFKGVKGQDLSSKQFTEGKFENIEYSVESIEEK